MKNSFKLEKDTTLTSGLISYEIPKSDYTYGFDFLFNEILLQVFHMKGEIMHL